MASSYFMSVLCLPFLPFLPFRLFQTTTSSLISSSDLIFGISLIFSGQVSNIGPLDIVDPSLDLFLAPLWSFCIHFSALPACSCPFSTSPAFSYLYLLHLHPPVLSLLRQHPLIFQPSLSQQLFCKELVSTSLHSLLGKPNAYRLRRVKKLPHAYPCAVSMIIVQLSLLSPALGLICRSFS